MGLFEVEETNFIRQGFVGQSKAFNINSVTPDLNAVCPKCHQASVSAGGSYIAFTAAVPVKVKAIFFNLTINLTVSVKYCPKCGYLSVTVKQGG